MSAFLCCIVDDEPIAIEIITAYLGRLEGYQIAGTFTNPVKAFEALQKMPVDLLFLDIQMPELTGLEFLQSLRQRPEVILTTAHRNFALEGFDLDVVDYLLKPIAFDRFLKALDKFHARRQNKNNNAEQHTEAKASAEPPHVFIRADRKNIKLILSEILYLESMKDYIRVVTVNGIVVTKDTLTHFEECLPAGQFIRVHRSFLVARDKITALSADGLEIGKTTLPVGRLYKLAVEKLILG